MIVERGALVEQIVGADDRGVAAGVATADPALFQHRHVAHAVDLGEIIGCAEPMAAAADDNGVIGRLGTCLPPLRLPALMMAQAVAKEDESREALHGLTPGPTGRRQTFRR